MSFNSKESYDIQASKLSAKEQDVNKPAEETRGIDAYKSFRAIMTVVDRHRPFEPSDFVKEYYIADIALAAPLALGAAMKFAPMIQQFLMNAKCM